MSLLCSIYAETFSICGDRSAFGIAALLAQWRFLGYTPRFINVRTTRSSEKVVHDFRFTHLRIITERNLKSPCIKALQTSPSPTRSDRSIEE